MSTRTTFGAATKDPIFPQTVKHWGSNLRYRKWENVTPVPGSYFPLVSLSFSLSGQMPAAVTPAPGLCLALVSLCLWVASPTCPCVSHSLRSDARHCDAGSGVMSPACLPASPRLQMPHAVTLAPSPACLPVLWVVSPACLLRLPSLCAQTPDAVTLAPGRVSRLSQTPARLCLPLVVSSLFCVSPISSVSCSLCGQVPDTVTLATGSCLLLVSLCLSVSAAR